MYSYIQSLFSYIMWYCAILNYAAKQWAGKHQMSLTSDASLSWSYPPPQTQTPKPKTQEHYPSLTLSPKPQTSREPLQHPSPKSLNLLQNAGIFVIRRQNTAPCSINSRSPRMKTQQGQTQSPFVLIRKPFTIDPASLNQYRITEN